MKKKVFLIVNINNKIEHIFLKRFSAIGWLANYRNCLPKNAAPMYWNRYKVVIGYIYFGKET